MERLKEAAKVLKMYPKLKLGEKLPGKGVKSTGAHKVKFLAEPTTTKMRKGSNVVKAFKFLVEENGVTYKWLVPITNEDGEGHYLVEHLQDVKVGEEVTLEMKKSGAINYIDVLRDGETSVEEGEVDPESEDEPSIDFSDEPNLQG